MMLIFSFPGVSPTRSLPLQHKPSIEQRISFFYDSGAFQAATAELGLEVRKSVYEHFKSGVYSLTPSGFTESKPADLQN